LQVRLDETEFREIRRVARANRTTVAAWVRETLRSARRRETLGESSDKIAAVRRAARHAFPAGDLEEMLDEIERGNRGPDAT
jgi:predicted 2-oxoglutarate/Fe(II)-dependent dioxygenase YbiX